MDPLVSVHVLTYNQEKYIVQCLEGILMQRTDFPFEVIVGEDCSTDRTRAIVIQYQEKYPETVKAILSPVNLGASENSRQVGEACRGKYHASCEGDDYWIDPLKLQKQVDLMEAYPEVSMCFHDAFMIRDGKLALPQYYCPPDLPERIGVPEVLRQLRLIPTASILVRAEMFTGLPAWRTEIRYHDLLTRLWCAHHGEIAFLNEVMSVYRVQPRSMIMSNDSQDVHRSEIEKIFRRFDAETDQCYSSLIEEALRKLDREYRFKKSRARQGKWVFLIRPDKALENWQEREEILRRYWNMFSR